MSAAGDPTGAQPTEEELRAAYEAEVKKIRVEHVLLENVVTLINLGMRRTGIAPGTEAERDPGQVQIAVEAVRRLLPLVEQAAPAQVKPIRDALSQLQLAFVKLGGQPTAEAGTDAPPPPPPTSAPRAPGTQAPDQAPAAPESPSSGQPGPAQRSGRLWIPGQ